MPLAAAFSNKMGWNNPFIIGPCNIARWHDILPMQSCSGVAKNLFIGALSGTHIARSVIENNRVVGEERLLAGENQRFRDITQETDNSLYAITEGGRLYRIDRQWQVS